MALRLLTLLFPAFCLPTFCANAQESGDPSAKKPYRAVVQTGIALQWFDEQFKSFTLSAERPLNLYNHLGAQANFFFPNDDYYYRGITSKTFEVGIFSKHFFHGRLTGRRSKAYIGPDFRLGRRVYLEYRSFSNQLVESKASTFKVMARIGWQYHFGPAVLELALPFGIENEKFKNQYSPDGSYYYDYSNRSRFVASPMLSLGIGF